MPPPMANGKINVVLCKSQDRFARDIEIIEKYKKFEEYMSEYANQAFDAAFKSEA